MPAGPPMLRQMPREIGYPVFIKQVASVPHLPGGTAIRCFHRGGATMGRILHSTSSHCRMYNRAL
jgi:hypothetical protein